MANIPFKKELTFEHGVVDQISPLIRRVIAPNPSAFTLHGTGTYIIGHGQVGVIDPGPDDPGHIAAIMNALKGETISHIIITHTHRDHSPGAALLQAATGATIWGCGPHGHGRLGKVDAQAVSEEGADTDYRPDTMANDADILDTKEWSLQAVYTPGHTSNHTCYHLREENTLFTGDHVMGWSTTIVSPPDGDMYRYMQSLKKLLLRSDDYYWPTHGPRIENPKAFVAELIKHREEREVQIALCLTQQVGRIPDMVKTMYRDVPEHLHQAAARSVFSHLVHMVDTDRAFCDGVPGPDTVYRAA
ncbi:MAG: MBL fold metallo-hydrolase [Rhodospirillaceae bacterium]|jgi:glyoxylase-like metal-dependent hydrolase (beta-lactamase superfamily II)|nr:MBL fold metallo-hydrolase [Rhodospirillaceae bacterium]MBT4042610.1 MBL fold metallo-hydrolase [Rhodospirillaceae bacterium]MBT4690011.1 MBL fold metallo-hydrolase [Rhodospirillaceae bacterium]MBT5081183.1 MBL fold metallo-hydrolase [Rhodospirillaceae bacterium]MBT5523509.1 MBL fold metallo-hydrolase [Rhodospirillaceae bacterium]